MPVFSIVLYLLYPVFHFWGVDYALAYKGCVAPNESFKIGCSFLVADLLLKLALLPLCNQVEDYFTLCIIGDSAILIYDIVVIYWQLRRKNLRTVKKFPSNKNYTLVGIWIVILYGLSLLFESWLVYKAWLWADSSEILAYVIMCDTFGFLILIFCLMTMLRLDRIKIPAMRSLQSLQSNHAPILLLRSFELDKYPWWNNKTFDEELCGCIDSNECPIISLADPDQILPTGGSLKIQSKDEYWKLIVEELLKSCRAIVIVEGDSEGLSWEIERIREIYKLCPEKIFFYIPSNRYRVLAWCINNQGGYGIMRNLSALMLKMFYPRTIRKQLKACWTNFTSFIESKGFKVTDRFPGSNKLISFDGNGNPEIIKRKKGFQLFQEILRRTQAYTNGSYDYAGLGKKIELYEVNGFMKESELKEYKRTVSYISKANYIIASILFAFGLITWFVV